MFEIGKRYELRSLENVYPTKTAKLIHIKGEKENPRELTFLYSNGDTEYIDWLTAFFMEIKETEEKTNLF